MSHARLSTAIIQSIGLKSEWNFHITWTTFPVWFSFFSHFYPIHDSELYLNTLWDKIINARNFSPSHCHVCFFKKLKACVVWLMHCDEHFGQEGDKLGVSSTKSVVDILPKRTSSRGEYFFFVLLIDGIVFFFTKYWSYFPLFINAMITEKASDKCNLEANYSMLFISTYKNCKIIPIQRQQVMMFLLR